MTQNQKKSLKEWERYAVSVHLLQQEEDDLEDNGKNSSGSGDNGANKGECFPVMQFLEASLVYYHPSFGGSGTTMIAAEQLGRRARLIELSPKYCSVIIRRWEKVAGGKAEKI